MKYSLKTKLSLSYVLIALISVFLISALSNVFLESQFSQYIINKQEQQNEDISAQIANQYLGDGEWNYLIIENIGLNVLQEGLIIKVKDMSGKTIWDATIYNYGLCSQMLEHVSKNMMSRYPNWQGEYVEYSHKLISGQNEVGVVEIGYYGPFFFNDNELAFINTLNRLLVVVALFSLIMAFALGYLMSKWLSQPIANSIKVAKKISTGCYTERITRKENTKELIELTDTINSLADTLERQEKMQKRLTADVAHELRTPLTTLQSHLEAMLDGIWKPDEQRLKALHKEILRINRMVGHMESLAKFEGENIILTKEKFDITNLIKEIAQTFEYRLEEKATTINVIGNENIICADKDKISQIIINLISNAVKYTGRNGIIDIKISKIMNSVRIIISDNGVGISKEDLPYIFERLYRVDRSRSSMTGGAGIGLAIVKVLVEAHNGTISVVSKLSEGTEFTIVLPK